MEEDNFCNYCENEIAKVKCNDFKLLKIYCEHCFIIRHLPEKFQNHKKSDYIQEDILCKMHNELKNEFICKICEKRLCIKCKEKIEHKNHEIFKLNFDNNRILDYINSELEKLNNISEKIERIRLNEMKPKKELLHGLSEIKKEVNDYFSQFFTSFIKKRTEILNQLHSIEIKYSQHLLRYNLNQRILKNHLHRKINLFNKLKLEEVSNIQIWKAIDSEVEKFGNIEKKYLENESMSRLLFEENLKLMKISPKKLVSKFENISKIMDESMKNIINLNFNSKFFLNINIPNIDNTNPERKIQKLIDHPIWKNKIVHKSSGNYCSIFYDFITKKFYYGIGYSDLKSIYEFSSLDFLFSGQNSRQIKLQSGIAGTYCIANRGFLIYSIYNGSKIGKANLSNGFLEEELDLGNVGYNQTYHFILDAIPTDIALFSDAHSETIFVMYQFKNENCGSLNEIKIVPKLELGKSWKLPFEKRKISFCMINDYILYMGFNGHDPKFNKTLNLIDNSNMDIGLNFKIRDWIDQVSYFPEDKALIIGCHPSFYRHFAEWK